MIDSQSQLAEVSDAVRQSTRQKCLAFALLAVGVGLLAGGLWLGMSLEFVETDPDLLRRLSTVVPATMAGLFLLAAVEFGCWRWWRNAAAFESRAGGGMLIASTAAEALLPTFILFGSLEVLGVAGTFGSSVSWFYFPVIILAALTLRSGLCWLAGGVSAVGFLAVAEIALFFLPLELEDSFWAARVPYYIKGGFLLVTAGFSAWVAQNLRQRLRDALQHAAERDRAVGIFGQHVSPEVARRLLDQPFEEEGESRRVCVLFLDIRDFSKFAAAHSAKEVMDYLNGLFGELIDLVNEHKGIINKLLGDGFMAVFGAPSPDQRPSLNATRCALAILEKTRELQEAGKIPPTRLGIGLHVGESMTGNVGGSSRKEYTVIGDTVNVAARVEQATKEFGAQLLVSEEVWNELPGEEFSGEDLGEVALKGQSRTRRLRRLV